METPQQFDVALLIKANDQTGVLYQLTKIISEHDFNITYVDMPERADNIGTVYFELTGEREPSALIADLEGLPFVRSLAEVPPLRHIYGKRIIVIGGGVQVSQVAMGAISEADRHNIRGERISVDTIPLVGEAELAAAVRAVARLPRVQAVVLAGALMGGDISEAVREVREKGILVVSLNMAGSVPDVADLVVSDPLQAGVMTVMAIARTAKFDINRQRGRRY
jgi:energy-converting hydrogenase B subunit Q